MKVYRPHPALERSFVAPVTFLPLPPEPQRKDVPAGITLGWELGWAAQVEVLDMGGECWHGLEEMALHGLERSGVS